MKKNRKVIIVIVFFTFLGLISFGIINRQTRVSQLEERIKTLPDFSIRRINGDVFNFSEITEGPVLLAYYHPECAHCRYEIDEILSNLGSIGSTKVILVSFASRDSIAAFFDGRLSPENNKVMILMDESLDFMQYLGISYIPTTLIYDTDLNLIKIFKGEVKPETLINSIRLDD